MRSRAVAALLASAVCVGATPAAVEADGGAKTRIKIEKLKRSGASGTVRSGSDRCVEGRKVRFFRLDGYLSVKVQFAKTAADGDWRIERDLQPGRYFAKVDSASGCRFDNSKIERLR